MTELNLFMVVFSAQILLLSAYYPFRVLSRAKRVLEQYPPSEYPKLYPKSSNFFTRCMSVYQYINIFNFLIGWVLFYFIYNGQLVGESGINPLLPWGYFMLQMLPSQWLEFYGFRLSKLMKKQDTRTTRSAQLTPRRLGDYISPLLMGTVFFSYFAFVGLTFLLDQFSFSTDSNGFLLSVILLIAFLFFATMSAWLVYGKKQDPYQNAKDRQRSVGLVIRTLCFTFIASTVFMALTLFVQTQGLKSVMPVLMSLFLQFLVIISMGFMLNNLRLEDIDFNVYKAQ